MFPRPPMTMDEANRLDDERVAWMMTKRCMTPKDIRELNARGCLPGFPSDGDAERFAESHQRSMWLKYFSYAVAVVVVVTAVIVTTLLAAKGYEIMINNWASSMLMRS